MPVRDLLQVQSPSPGRYIVAVIFLVGTVIGPLAYAFMRKKLGTPPAARTLRSTQA
ncbi:hypothetical protein FOA52_003381 [Chlamydomonas sp. UWO 241]|nr:hypothetical protein FOA52_003381 [Chlamydomonas sp. UWO 241]